MTLKDYETKLDELAKKVLANEIEMSEYNQRLINLINGFYDEAYKAPKEDLIADMLNFVIQTRKEQA